MHSQVGVADLSGVRTARDAQYSLRTVSHHSTQACFYLFTTVRTVLRSSVDFGLCRGQHFSPSGLAGNGNDKDKGRERVWV